MIRSLYRHGDGNLYTDIQPSQLKEAIQDKNGLLWVDFVDEPKESCMPILRDTFGFHPLAIDDALEESHVPKVDDWGEYLYIVLHGVVFNPEAEEILSTNELDIFLGDNYLVTTPHVASRADGRGFSQPGSAKNYFRALSLLGATPCAGLPAGAILTSVT